jgi:hypothetical protein
MKNALSKIESLCYADSKHIFGSKIVQVLSEKNVFKVDVKQTIKQSRPPTQDDLHRGRVK